MEHDEYMYFYYVDYVNGAGMVFAPVALVVF